MSTTTTPDGRRGTRVPYRSWMRANGKAPVGRSRGRSRPKDRFCVKCGVREADGYEMSLDHIVPQSKLADHPEVRDSELNHQWMCRTICRTTNSGRRVAERWGCNEMKGDGPAVDYRGKASLYRGLVRLLIKHDVEIDVAWKSIPFMGREFPKPSVVH